MSLKANTRSTAGTDFTDAEFVRRIASGDEEAFEALMRKHNRMLYRTARAILGNDADAEDALQRAYLKAYTSIAEFRGQARLSTWMTRIVVNESLMQLRRRRNDANVIAFDRLASHDEELIATNWQAMQPHAPETNVLRTQMRELVERKIDALPDAFRVVFVLRAVEDLSVESTAVALGIPESTVRTRFFRARGLLRETLANEIDSAIEDAFAFAGERCDRIVAAVLGRLKQPFT